MKLLILAAALTLGTAAAAQTDPNSRGVPPGDGITAQGTNPDGQACSPAGYNVGLGGYPPCTGAQPAATPQSSANPPACSKTVTDHCTQTYERGVRR